MKVVIFLRNTEDWAKASYEDILCNNGGFGDKEPRLVESLLPKWEAWNNKFCIDYLDYRQRIKHIAMDNWGNRPVYQDWQSMLAELEDDDVVIPTDDDDWIHPHIEHHFGNLFRYHDCAVWDQVTYNTFSGKCEKRYDYHLKMGSNNYAAKVRFLRKADELFPNRGFAKKFLMNHGTVTSIMSVIKCNYVFINEFLLSCYNWHVGSASVMMGYDWEKWKNLNWRPMKKPEFSWINTWSNQFDHCLLDLLHKLY